jgi:phage-related protein
MATQNLGTLLVKLNADSKAFVDGFAKAAKQVQSFANQTKEVSEKVAGAATILVGLGTAAVAMAAQVDDRAQHSLGRLTESAQLLAVQVSDVLEPALKTIGGWFTRAADWVAGLDAKTKEQIATWATWAAGILVAAKAAGVLAGAISAIASIAGGAATGIAALGAGGIAAIAALAAVVVLLHKAWRENFAGMQDVAREFVASVSDAFTVMRTNVASAFEGTFRVAITYLEKMLELYQAMQGIMGPDLRSRGGGVTMDPLAGLRGVLESMKTTGLAGLAAKGIDAAKRIATDLGSTFTKELDLIKAEAMKALGLGGGSSSSGSARKPSLTQYDVGTVGSNDTQSGAAGWIKSIFDTKLVDNIRTGTAQWMAGMDLITAAFNNMEANTRLIDDASARELEEIQSRGAYLEKIRAAQQAIDDDDLKKKRDAIAENFSAMKRMVASTFTKMGGVMGQFVSDVVEGAKSGGIWGALLAMVGNLVNRMEGFSSVLAYFEEALNQVASAIGPLLQGVFGFIKNQTAVGTEMIVDIIKNLAPLFEGITSVLKDLAPILSLIAMLFKFVGAILHALGTLIGGILKALSPVFKLFFTIIKYVVLALGYVIGAIVAVVNKFIQFIAWLIEAFGDKKTAREMRDGMTNMNEYWDSLREMSKMTWDQVTADQANTTSTWDAKTANDAAAKSAQAVAEALTNVPNGYRIALARFNAESMPGTSTGTGTGSSTPPGTPTNSDGSSGGGSPKVGPIGGRVGLPPISGLPPGLGGLVGAGASGGLVVAGDVNITTTSAIDPNKLAAQIDAQTNRAFAQRNGFYLAAASR